MGGTRGVGRTGWGGHLWMGQIPSTAGGAGGFPPPPQGLSQAEPPPWLQGWAPHSSPPSLAGPWERSLGSPQLPRGGLGASGAVGAGLQRTRGCPWGPAAAAAAVSSPRAQLGPQTSGQWPWDCSVPPGFGVLWQVGMQDPAGPRVSPGFPPRFSPPRYPRPAGAARRDAGPGPGLSRPEQQVAQVPRDPPV